MPCCQFNLLVHSQNSRLASGNDISHLLKASRLPASLFLFISSHTCTNTTFWHWRDISGSQPSLSKWTSQSHLPLPPHFPLTQIWMTSLSRWFLWNFFRKSKSKQHEMRYSSFARSCWLDSRDADQELVQQNLNPPLEMFTWFPKLPRGQ